LKRITPLCTLVGAAPGAVPPLNRLGRGARAPGSGSVAALLVVFLWQFHHVMSIAWIYRDDYERPAMSCPPVAFGETVFITVHTLLPLLGLVLVSVLLCTDVSLRSMPPEP